MKNCLKTHAFSLFVVLIILLSLVGTPTIRSKAASTITFTAGELLGKPEDTSITINIVPASTVNTEKKAICPQKNLSRGT
ncbi:MAG: hypothetical protein ABSF99_08815 [Anaerolineales bacterium]|jgi:hypothetical protein